MAAPTVAGIIALMLDRQPSLTIAMIKGILSSSARKDANTGDTRNNSWGYGKIDALSALNHIREVELTGY